MYEIIEKENLLIEDMIYEIRGKQVMFSKDVALLYQVETKRINEVIKNHRLEYLRNNQIFVLNKNELTPKDIETIETIADIKLFGNIGGIKNNLEEIENNKKEELQIQYKEIGTSEKIAEDEL